MYNPYEDITLNCTCGREFIWTAGEQAFMNDLYEKGKIAEVCAPKRCKECRLEKKRRIEGRESQY